MRVRTPLKYALGAALLSVASVNAELPINGWYPCSYSDYIPAGAVPGISSSAELAFECAEAKVPLCHEGVCNSGSKIDVYVKRMVAQKDVSAHKSLWVLQGGPGASSVALETTMQQVYTLLNGTVNVYTMDHRGTGRSYLLKCEAAGAFDTGSPGGSVVNITEAAVCAKDILFQIENQPAAFSVTSAAKDIVLLTSELNKDEEVFVYGASYGTFLTERVMHLAPSHVKGYILDGVVSEQSASFAHFGSNRDKPGRLFSEMCDADAVCREKYGSDVPKEQKMYDAWFDTYKKLDAAKVGENACADLLRGKSEQTKSSEVLRFVFANDANIGDPASRSIIPAVFQMLRRCDENDVKTLTAVLALDGAPSYYDKLSGASSSTVGKVFDPVDDSSVFLEYLIKISELWSDPLPKPEDERALVETGLFTIDTGDEYAWHCVLGGNRDSPSCSALAAFGATEVPPVDYSPVEVINFTYKPDQYFRKFSKIPEGASVMVINGKLDFNTIEGWGVEQYEKMEGDKKMLVEFDYGAHCVGISQSTAEDTTNCGPRIIASYVATGGDIDKTDTSCLDELPAIDFDVDEMLAQVASKGAAKAKITLKAKTKTKNKSKRTAKA
ncbi:hypothetical protein Poli38472_014752 [Pythium oligandrum]|uniref:AB hydrolase-1 domain-containing protein n=1 Tax=Pythium oligandrum TaxID=41045 RepID=A0A8K1C207_PYTOL|nr:hypothetical protein Poli38472_014752 [Pythium oligandrum]|eukprot:TMW54981.1 hypothetical protein Poli38472_014752 [Pythium oligandrum]